MRIRKNEELVHRLLVETGAVEIDEDGRCWKNGRSIGSRSSTGYLLIKIRKSDGHSCTAMVHRLVWRYFNGPIPDGMVINHRNLDKLDNRPGNLEPLTQRENVHHALRNGARSTKISAADVEDIRRRYGAGVSQGELADEFRVSRSTIYCAATGRSWAHISGVTIPRRQSRKRSSWRKRMTDEKLDELIEVFSR